MSLLVDDGHLLDQAHRDQQVAQVDGSPEVSKGQQRTAEGRRGQWKTAEDSRGQQESV